ncbi:MAG: site-2 protease family protein, partial [Fibrobacter sp.]|nr:site-2 protease family protein [Fibrobacter sp.]
THISSYDDVVFQVNQSSGADLLFTILRGKVTVRGADTIRGVDTIPITMRAVFDEESKRYMVGIQMAYVMFQETHLVRRNPVAASVKAAKTSWKMTSSIFIYFKRLAQGQVKADAFSGPVTIVAVMGRVWMSGFDQFLMLLALISVNLGVMNLLPLAITDGGLLMFLGIEKIRGRPLSQGKQVIIQKIAILFFISFFVFITILDFEKIGLFLKR